MHLAKVLFVVLDDVYRYWGVGWGGGWAVYSVPFVVYHLRRTGYGVLFFFSAALKAWESVTGVSKRREFHCFGEQ